ncbi:MAG: hypothetical protein ABIQ41_02740 [Gemmatimonadales bacterium]
MELRFAHLADYAAQDASGKLTIVGVFDVLWDQLKVRPVPFPPCYLVASFAGSLAEGSDHPLSIDFLDGDEQPVRPSIQGTLKLRTTGPGYPTRGILLLGFGPGALTLPGPGDYRVRFLVGGVDCGGTPISIHEPPQKT